jgi:hypothetical protein
MQASPKPKQIEEWCDNEVTRYFLSLLKATLDDTYKRRGEVFYPFEPMRTQEAKAHLIGAEGALQDVIEAIEEKDLSQLEIESEEPVRNPSVRGQSTDQAG